MLTYPIVQLSAIQLCMALLPQGGSQATPLSLAKGKFEPFFLVQTAFGVWRAEERIQKPPHFLP